MMNFKLESAWLMLPVLAVLAGCGGSGNYPATVPVTGIVKLSGQPVPGATVTFQGTQNTAFAITGPDGRFQLTTFESGDGAVPGDYQVGVVKMIQAGVDSGPADDSMEAAAAAAEVRQGDSSPQSALPARYNNPTSSGLMFTVAGSGSNDFEIQLSP